MDAVNVLVVDDDESVRAMLKIAFSVEEGVAEVREAGDADGALTACSGFAPDIIFLDHWMPGATGGDVAPAIRKMCPEARIVAYSGVLEATPEWADELYVKGDLPDLSALIRSLRRVI